jgi:hypothetical protein
MHDRDFEWKSINGTLKLKDMEDTHLANIIHLIKFNRIKRLKDRLKNNNLVDWQIESLNYSLAENKSILSNMLKEFKYRKLDKSLIDNAPHPFKDKDGLLKTWNYDTNGLQVVSSAKRFITDGNEE